MTLERFELLRILEAMLFASHAPLSEKDLAVRLPEGANIVGMLDELKAQFANRGVHLTPVGTGWAFRTAPDLAAYMGIEKSVV